MFLVHSKRKYVATDRRLAGQMYLLQSSFLLSLFLALLSSYTMMMHVSTLT